MTLTSSSSVPCSRSELWSGWICNVDEEGFPLNWPNRWASSFCCAIVISWLRKKTTPRWETLTMRQCRLVRTGTKWPHTGDSKISKQGIRVWSCEEFFYRCIRELLTNRWSKRKIFIMLPKHSWQLQRFPRQCLWGWFSFCLCYRTHFQLYRRRIYHSIDDGSWELRMSRCTAPPYRYLVGSRRDVIPHLQPRRGMAPLETWLVLVVCVTTND